MLEGETPRVWKERSNFGYKGCIQKPQKSLKPFSHWPRWSLKTQPNPEEPRLPKELPSTLILMIGGIRNRLIGQVNHILDLVNDEVMPDNNWKSN